MKKFFAVMIVVVAIASCNDNTKNTESKMSSADSSMLPTTTMDSTPVMSSDTSAVKMSDTTMKK